MTATPFLDRLVELSRVYQRRSDGTFGQGAPVHSAAASSSATASVAAHSGMRVVEDGTGRKGAIKDVRPHGGSTNALADVTVVWDGNKRAVPVYRAKGIKTDSGEPVHIHGTESAPVGAAPPKPPAPAQKPLPSLHTMAPNPAVSAPAPPPKAEVPSIQPFTAQPKPAPELLEGRTPAPSMGRQPYTNAPRNPLKVSPMGVDGFGYDRNLLRQGDAVVKTAFTGQASAKYVNDPKKLLADNPALATSLKAKAPYSEGGKRSKAIEEVARIQGFNGVPTKGNPAEHAAGGGVVLHRGVKQQAQAEQFRTGAYYGGTGLGGAGTYFTTDLSGAKSYGKATVTAALPKTARVIDQDAARNLPSFGPNGSWGADPGVKAALHGYDAMRLPNSGRTLHDAPQDYFILLNRSIMVVD